MKLPGSNERFIVANQSSVFYGHVVSGIHLEVRGDDDVPSGLCYYVFVDRVYEGDSVFCPQYNLCISCSFTLQGALDCVARNFTPCREGKADETAAGKELEAAAEKDAGKGLVIREKTGDGRGLEDASGIQKETGALDNADRGCRKYIYRLMYLMGHEDIDTTRRYLHMANEILASQGCISHLDGILNGEI